jgi:hypothetical protein
MVRAWALFAIAIFPVAARFRGSRSNAPGDVGPPFLCPVDIPTGPQKKARTQGPYFESLFNTLLHGNGQTKYYGESTVELVGCKDGTFQESWVKDHKPEMRCLYAMMLADFCSGIQSSHKKRQEAWELTCLDPDKTVTDAYKLMTKKEFKYLRRLNQTVTHPDSAVGARFSLKFDMIGYKELACITMKVIDDDCIKPLNGPRLLPDWYWTSGKAPTPAPHVPKPNTGSKWFEDKLDEEYQEANPEEAAQFTLLPANATNSSIRLHLLNSTNRSSATSLSVPITVGEKLTVGEKAPLRRSSMYRHLVEGNFSLRVLSELK